MRYETTRTTTLSAQRVWDRLVDVEQWPRLVDTYRSVRSRTPGPVALGSRFHVVQVGLRPADWEVVALVAGTLFTWRSSQPGLHARASHRVEADATGGSRLTLDLELRGALSPVVQVVLGGRVRRYVDLEAAAFTATDGPP